MKNIPLKNVYGINAASRLTGVSNGAIAAARRNARLTQHELGDGSPVVDIREVKKMWPEGGQAGRGRPKGAKKKSMKKKSKK